MLKQPIYERFALCNPGSYGQWGHEEKWVSRGRGHPRIRDRVIEVLVRAHPPKNGELVYVLAVGAGGGLLDIWDVEGLEDG